MNKQSFKVEFLNNGFIMVSTSCGLRGLYNEITGKHAGLDYSERAEQLAKFAALGMITEGWH